MMRAGVAAVALAIAASVAGCAGTGASTDTGTPSGDQTAKPAVTRLLVPLTSPEVLAYCPDIEAVHLADVDVDAGSIETVTVCTTEEVRSGESTTATAVIERASRVDTGTDLLLEAYRAPNAPKTSGACIELAADPLLVWIETPTGLRAVYAPVDKCGFPSSAAAEAYAEVGLTTLAEVELPIDGATPEP